MKMIQLLGFALLSLVSFTSSAEKLTADEIIRKANLSSYYAGDDGRAEARMKITDAQGRTRLRQFTILRRDDEDGGQQQMLVFFSRPTDVKNTAFRVIRQPETDDSRWLYLPSLDLVKRISSGDKRTSFVGADFFYEDISGRNTNADTHKLLKDNGEQFHLSSTPKDPSLVEFSRYESWIDKQTFLPMLVKYYDQNGKLYRQMKVLKTKVIQGHPIAVSAEMKNFDTGSTTLMQMRRIKFDLGLPQAIFSERSMKNPPIKWLR
ncbi:outer membrane lipoprotein-sorting protein [Parashewanella tropica]|uniref:outer membrane lipoprotein-sorting protein n=1 Tax=Parashewanella tropica TaxID=2547970 RepID=UPI00105985CF|nr:outer membrane lipoprotein-sorting protein [Parashewanella tropica]